jgi:Arc/MetJ-type ribon-helix-helix transcriptional regulator
MAQLVTRVDDELAAAVDVLVEQGEVASRSEAVRLGLEQWIDHVRRRRVGEQIVQGYRERPQGESELGWADQATVAMIADEPW